MFDISPSWLVDLTQPVRPGYGDIPGHPKTEIIPIHTHESHMRSNAALITSIHAGTHVDSPYHFFKAGISIDRVSISVLCGKAVLFDLKDVSRPGYGFSPDDLRGAASAAGVFGLYGWRVIIKSGWGSCYGTPDYYKKNPHLTRESAEWLVQEGVAMVGLDFPPDGIGDKMTVPAPAPVHETLLGAGVCILENLAGLEMLQCPVFGLLCLPLRLEGEGGGPARVVAYSLGDEVK